MNFFSERLFYRTPIIISNIFVKNCIGVFFKFSLPIQKVRPHKNIIKRPDKVSLKNAAVGLTFCFSFNEHTVLLKIIHLFVISVCYKQSSLEWQTQISVCNVDTFPKLTIRSENWRTFQKKNLTQAFKLLKQNERNIFFSSRGARQWGVLSSI